MIACPQCEHLNPEGADSCGGCGAPLLASPRVQENSPAPARPVPDAASAFPTPRSSPGPSPEVRPPAVRFVVPQAAGLQRRSVDLLQGADDSDRPAAPFFALNLNRFLIDGCDSHIGILLENRSQTDITDIEISLESRGFRETVVAKWRALKPGEQHRWPVMDLHPIAPGHPPLHCQIEFSADGQKCHFYGPAEITIFRRPENPANVSYFFQEMQSIKGGAGHNPGLGAQFGNINITNNLGTIRTLNDLLAVRLPEDFVAIPVELNYEISESSIAESGTKPGGKLRIPHAFRKVYQPATALRFKPTADVAALPGILEIRVFARDAFRLGRNPKPTEFHAFFRPTSSRDAKESEALNKTISQVHLTARLAKDGPALFDGDYDGRKPSTNKSNFDGQPLSHDAGTAITMSGKLVLAGKYVLDVIRCDSGYTGEPDIALSKWIGKDRSKHTPPDVRGAVRFRTYETNPADVDALWLFTDASWGSSEWNAIVTRHQAVDEIQARIHYYRGCFWIEQSSNDHPITLHSADRREPHEMKRGEIAPLAQGQQIRIGVLAFDVETKP